MVCSVDAVGHIYFKIIENVNAFLEKINRQWYNYFNDLIDRKIQSNQIIQTVKLWEVIFSEVKLCMLILLLNS